MKTEKGYFLLEVILLTCIVAAAGSSFLLYGCVNVLQQENDASVTAVFIAREQLAMVEKVERVRLQDSDSLPWLGYGTMPVERNGRSYTIETQVRVYEQSTVLRRICVKVSWPDQAHVRSIELQQMVNCHE